MLGAGAVVVDGRGVEVESARRVIVIVAVQAQVHARQHDHAKEVQERGDQGSVDPGLLGR